MNVRLLVEMVRVALGAIWSNKLRSLLTILGNVVAVASIVTLVSLIQGITEEVTNVILTQVGADAFLIARVGIVTSEEEAISHGQRNNSASFSDGFIQPRVCRGRSLSTCATRFRCRWLWTDKSVPLGKY